MAPEGIILLGGTGFVGKSLTNRLRELNKEIYIVGRGASMAQVESSKEYYVASMDNTQMLKELLPKSKVVVHLASDTTPGASALQPTIEATANLIPSLRLLEILQDYPHILLIYVSTGGAIYGDCNHSKINESVQLSPLSYYGAGKAAFEKFILAYTKQTGNRAIILRPANFYGPGQPYRAGFGIIPTIFHHLLSSETMEIWGDGKTVRDYLYVYDFVECCLKIFDELKAVKTPAIYNVGSGKGVDLNTLLAMIEDISGLQVKRKYRSARTVDVKNVVLDCSQLIGDFHWQPTTDLYSGLSIAWKWYRDQTLAR